MLLITGCPRSGTNWASRVLQSLGRDMGHEKLGKHGIVSWCLAPEKVEPAHLPKWHGDVTGFEPKAVIHLVRHPIDTIASLVTVGRPAKRFVARSIGLEPDMPPLLWAMLFWLEWNEIAEARALFTQRVEDVRSEVPRSNTRQHEAVTWEQLWSIDGVAANEVREMAQRYGYGAEDGKE